MDQNISLTSFPASYDFFAPVRRLHHSSPSRPLPAAGIFRGDAEGAMSCLLLTQPVSPELRQVFEVTRRALTDLCGLASAYVRRRAEMQKNPGLVYDPGIWQTVYNHLPLMGDCAFEARHFRQTCQGVEFPALFLESIIDGVASGAAAIDNFKSCLETIGATIQAGFAAGAKTYHVGLFAITLDEIEANDRSALLPRLKAFFIDFTDETSAWRRGCRSYRSFDLNFSYATASAVFDYRALAEPRVKASFETLIQGSHIDVIAQAPFYFQGER
jgi:hypothetical protein